MRILTVLNFLGSVTSGPRRGRSHADDVVRPKFLSEGEHIFLGDRDWRIQTNVAKRIIYVIGGCLLWFAFAHVLEPRNTGFPAYDEPRQPLRLFSSD